MRVGELSDLQPLGHTPEHLLPRLQRLRLTEAMKAERARSVEHLYGVFFERISAGAGPNELWLDGVVEPWAGDTTIRPGRAGKKPASSRFWAYRLIFD
ncbi:hypothetical protein PENSPDRAFT_651838 [Peniophora sp. CONT]|nr:hypothetical protein PENSPDRAFT_651838 [Peniophora sp. CONT]